MQKTMRESEEYDMATYLASVEEVAMQKIEMYQRLLSSVQTFKGKFKNRKWEINNIINKCNHVSSVTLSVNPVLFLSTGSIVFFESLSRAKTSLAPLLSIFSLLLDSSMHFLKSFKV